MHILAAEQPERAMFTHQRGGLTLVRLLSWLVAATMVAAVVVSVPGFVAGNAASQRALLQASISPVESAQVRAVRARIHTYLSEPGESLMRDLRLSYRERSHLLEVKRLLRGARALGYGLAAAAGIGLLALTIIGLSLKRLRRVLAGLARHTAITMLVLALCCAGVVLWFDAGFVWLHELVFGGRDWLLPASSLTAQAFPESYFRLAGMGAGAGLLALATLFGIFTAALSAPDKK